MRYVAYRYDSTVERWTLQSQSAYDLTDAHNDGVRDRDNGFRMLDFASWQLRHHVPYDHRTSWGDTADHLFAAYMSGYREAANA